MIWRALQKAFGMTDRDLHFYRLNLKRRLRNPYPRGSIYGISAPGITPLFLTIASNVTLTAGTEVTIGTFAQLVGTPGLDYIPIIIGNAVALMGGTASAALVYAALFTGGADFATQTVDTGALVNSATVQTPVILVGANVRASANGNIGSTTIAFTGNATTTAATLRHAATQLYLLAALGPDL